MGDGDREDAFTRAMEDVAPLTSGAKRVPSRRLPKRRRPYAGHSTAPRLAVDRWGEHHQGLARGTPESVLRRLEAGDRPPQLAIDLHGMTEDGARAAVHDGLRRAARGKVQSIRIVHGRGLRSPDGPVLKNALPDWLAAPIPGVSIVAFTSAGRFGASGGATLVLLASS